MIAKYELLENDTKEWGGIKLFRIRALTKVGFTVSVGDIGGYIESEKNLSMYRDAWVSGNAMVCGNAIVLGNAWVSGDARIFGDVIVGGNARVHGSAWLHKASDIQFYSGVGSSNGTLTVCRTEDGIQLTRGYLQESLEEFRATVISEYGKTSKFGEYYLRIANLIEFWFDIKPVEKREAA